MLKLLTALLAFTVSGTLAAKLVGPYAQCGSLFFLLVLSSQMSLLSPLKAEVSVMMEM
jgi:hypothetical protein